MEVRKFRIEKSYDNMRNIVDSAKFTKAVTDSFELTNRVITVFSLNTT